MLRSEQVLGSHHCHQHGRRLSVAPLDGELGRPAPRAKSLLRRRDRAQSDSPCAAQEQHVGVISTMQFSIVLAVITFVAQKRRVSHQAQPAAYSTEAGH